MSKHQPEQRAHECAPSAPLVISEKAAARLLGIAESSLKKARLGGRDRGRLTPPPFVQLGRRIRYVVADLLSYIERNKRCEERDA